MFIQILIYVTLDVCLFLFVMYVLLQVVVYALDIAAKVLYNMSQYFEANIQNYERIINVFLNNNELARMFAYGLYANTFSCYYYTSSTHNYLYRLFSSYRRV
jgi:hypothetical protein